MTSLHQLLAPGVVFLATTLSAADLDEGRKQFLRGDYAECIQLAQEGIRDNTRDEEWPLLLIQSLLAVGRYADAASTLTESVARHRYSIRLRVLGFDVLRSNGKLERAKEMLDEVNRFAGNWRYRSPPEIVALGRAALLLGADPKLVLENFFNEARRADPSLRDTWLAQGELELEKEDYALASRTFTVALQRFPEDADLHYGLARAFHSSDRAEMARALDAALNFNPHHVRSLLLLADHAIDAEDHEAASEILDRALAVNPWQPEAWACRAVMAHLKNDSETEQAARETALKFWAANPRVDHLIGRKLSQKYRFAEGAALQRQALEFDPAFLPAKLQLAQDLLRLGDEEEGWRLAEEVHQKDGYDVTAYNLVNLRGTLDRYHSLTNEHFILRMAPAQADAPDEAAVYGERALNLLQRAHDALSARYGIQLARPTIVEIFRNQSDFAVRTFGMPDNPGFLGVCFGRVVTANSPASQSPHPANWEAVLWHEFCHVITLQMTHNKMPRWLSEGISVFEEGRENPAWGQSMDARYRQMILGDDLTPVSKLSAAFLSPKSDLHLQFAYYQSSLVVEFIVERFGFDSLKQILRDLGEGADIHQAIATHTEAMDVFDRNFASFARERARQLAPGLDWREIQSIAPNDHAETLSRLVERTPTNYWALTEYAGSLVSEKKWEEAKAPLRKLIELFPENAGANNPYALLARVHRELNETESEREALEKLAALDADATDAYLRLMELGESANDWPAVARNAERFVAVNPLVPQPYRFHARASEARQQHASAIESYRTLLLLDARDPANVHFRLARLLHQTGDASAKRHVLQALEEAPRFRDAHRLLLELVDQPAEEPATPLPFAPEATEPVAPREPESSTELESNTR